MLISIIALKLTSILAKDMVNSDIAKRTLAYAGKSFIQLGSIISESIRNQQNSYARIIDCDDHDDDETKQQKININYAPQSTEYLVYNWLEASFAWFQMIVLWHDPIVSIFTISALFISFLLLTYFAPKFYATIMIGIFVYNLTKVWFRHVWPEIRVPPANSNEKEAERSDVNRWTYLHPQVMTLNELQNIIRNLIKISEYYILENLLKLRREKPINFCILICSALSCTAYIGNRVCGFKLIFSMVLALFTLPGIYLYLLPESLKRAYLQNFSNIFQQLMQQHNEQPIQHVQLHQVARSNSQDRVGQKQDESIEIEAKLKPLSVFEQLKSYSFLTQLASLSPTSYVLSGISSSSTTINTLNDKMPIINENVTEEGDRQDGSMSFHENKNNSRSSCSSLESSAIRRKLSEDLSSNDESTSLIDLDDDQQDGFVML